jgi:hypothetical protein
MTVHPSRELLTGLLLSLTLLAAPSCRPERPDAPSLQPDAFKAASRLPPEFYGNWELLESSGGMDGQGERSHSIDRITITVKNTIETYKMDRLVSSVPFTPGKGKSIFTGGDDWVISRDNGSSIQVVRLWTNGTLSISDNHPDGYSYSYSRSKGGQR